MKFVTAEPSVNIARFHAPVSGGVNDATSALAKGCVR
jgi:hypothetical protein